MIDHLEIVFKILLAILLSSIIGLEREFRQKGAGLRTHILVCVGSTLIVLTSLKIFDVYNSVTPIDPSRMITGVIQGIGFLCGGAIIRGGDAVRGLTTAATLWIVSGIGIAIGVGSYAAAIIVTISVLFTLIIVRKIEVQLPKNSRQIKTAQGGK